MTSYSKMKKAELIAELKARDAAQATQPAQPAQATQPAQPNAKGQIFDMVKRRWNAHGPLYNCRFKAEVQSIPSLASMADEIQIDARARSEARKDRHGRIWVDIYPKSEERELFGQTEEVAS